MVVSFDQMFCWWISETDKESQFRSSENFLLIVSLFVIRSIFVSNNVSCDSLYFSSFLGEVTEYLKVFLEGSGDLSIVHASTYLELFFVLESPFIPRVTAAELHWNFPLSRACVTQTQWSSVQPKRSEEDGIVLHFLELSFIHGSVFYGFFNNNIGNKDFTATVVCLCHHPQYVCCVEKLLCIF